MEQRRSADPDSAAAILPRGRLMFDPVAAALLADGMVVPHEHERVQFSASGARTASDVHPLVLLANLKLHAAQAPAGELGLERLTEWLATRTGLRYLRIDPTRIDVAAVTGVVSHAYARRHRILPLALDAERVLIATSEPLALDWLADVQHLSRRRIELALINPLDLHRYTMEFFGVTQSVRGARGDARSTESNAGLPSFEQLVELGRAGDVNADDHHIVHIVDWLLQYAYEQRASDIHLEPRREAGRMRFRIDGVLHKVLEVPPSVMTAVVSRIKVLGRMDLAERRRPQDGRIKTRSPGGREVEMRLSTMPTAFGEKCVMRIFDPDSAFKSIEQLGFSPEEAAGWSALVERPHGIVLVTGPTGSGKTTTLYAALSLLNDGSRNILTVEDPVEYAIDGVGQTQVNARVGMTFAAGLRAILRQDPDVVMIGEIRDTETAQIAVQASLTGHLVLSTVHTNDAVGAVTRLRDMGIEPFLLASSLRLILAQRLVRRLCMQCRSARPIDAGTAQLLEAPADAAIYTAVGCNACHHSGYVGRVGIYEAIAVDDAMRRLIGDNADEDALAAVAFARAPRLGDAARAAVLQGLTTLEEALRVTRQQEDAYAAV